MSKGSRRKGANLRAPDTAKTQKKDCDVVPWTPVFTRGCLKLVVLTEPNAMLNKSERLADFVKNKLPAALNSMEDEWGWATIPRVILHDKTSYFVDNGRNAVHQTFARGLKTGRFRSWVQDDTSWLAPYLGDLYPHDSSSSSSSSSSSPSSSSSSSSSPVKPTGPQYNVGHILVGGGTRQFLFNIIKV